MLARTVDDGALGIEIANGGRLPSGEPYIALGDHRSVDVGKLRVAWYVEDETFATAPAIRRAVREAVSVLQQAGATAVEWRPPATRAALNCFGGILTADGGAGIRRFLAGSQRSPQVAQLLMMGDLPRSLLRGLRKLLAMAGQRGLASNLDMFGGSHVRDYWALIEAQLDYQRAFAAALDACPGGPIDAIVAPVSSLPAFTHGATRDLLTAGGYATLYNVLGYPAGVVPVTRVRAGEESDRPSSSDFIAKLARKVEQGSTGLPIGVQVIARPWQEHIAFAVMQAIHRAAARQTDFPATPIDPA